MKLLVQIDAEDLVKDIADGMGAAVRDAAVVFIAIPSVRLGASYIAVSLEFINTDGLRKFGWLSEVDGLKDRLDSVLGDMVPPCDLGESERLY